jgi:predicted PhzF superfamily epimerase YddE/YHI9
MTSLVIAEHDNHSIKPATLNTVTAALACGGEVHVLVAGKDAAAAAQAAAQIAGVTKVLHADADGFAHGLAEHMAAQVLALRPDAQVLQGLDIGVVGPRGKVGVVVAHEGGDAQFEVRAFFPTQNGLSEDPVTGSLNAALGQWLIGAGLAPAQYVASQGTALGRAGRVHVQRDADGQVWVGGDTVTCISGQVRL